MQCRRNLDAISPGLGVVLGRRAAERDRAELTIVGPVHLSLRAMIVPLSLVVASALVRPGAPSSTCSPRSAVQMSADVPSIVVGGGRIGSLMAELGETVVVKRGDPIPAVPATGPIYICTRNDALDGIVEATPPERRADLGAPHTP